MLSKLRSRLSYANVMASIAVFITLGGTSYAVATGSVDSREIKNNSVRTRDIRNNDVRSRDVRNRSLLTRDFAPGQLPAGPRGPQGPRGATGPRGAPGPTSAAITGTTPPTEFAGGINGSVATPTAGRLFVFASVRIGIGCTAGESTVGLYVDNVPVPGSRHDVEGGGDHSIQLFGITSSRVAAGEHPVWAGASCTQGGTPNSIFGGLFPSFGAIVLGG